jgi:RNA polymerase sigma factor (sigma-70 family)
MEEPVFDRKLLRQMICRFAQKRYRAPLLKDNQFFGELYTTMLLANNKFDPNRGFKKSTYITRAVRNKIIDLSKHIHTTQKALHPIEKLMGEKPSMKLWQDGVRQEQSFGRLDEYIDILPDNEKFVIVNRFLEGKPLKEVASGLGCCVEQVCKIQRKALVKLRNAANGKRTLYQQY